MILKFFRSSFVIQYFVIVAIALFLWLPSFLQPKEFAQIPEILNPLYHSIFNSLQFSPFWMVLIAFLLVLLQSFFFNSILSANLLISRISSIGAFVYILIFSLFESQTGLYPLLVSNIFILGAIHILFLIYNTRSNVELYIFNVSIMISLASLFYLPSIVLLFWMWICLAIIKSSNVREWIITIIGIILPYFLLATYYYLTDSLITKFDIYQHEFQDIIKIQIADLGWSEILSIAWLLVIFVFAINFTNSNKIERNVAIRNKISISYYLFVFAIPILFFAETSITHNSLLFITPAIIISILFGNTNETRFIKIMFVLLIILLLWNHYQTLFPDVFIAKIF